MEKENTSIIEKAMGKLEKKLGAPLKDAPSPTVSDPALSVGLTESTRKDFFARASSPEELNAKADSTTEFSFFPPESKDGVSNSNREIHTINLSELEKLGMVSPNFPKNRIAEEYRTIKRPLLMNIENRSATKIENANLIMVTSGMSGEGKTFSAVNLAISMAMEQDRTVLLVDADVTKASAAHLLGIPDDSPGLIDVLEGNVERFSDVLVHTSIPKLRVLPAGHLHDHATEVLASENMKRLMKELSARYPDRVIIFDSPPLLMTSEASVLANHMGQVVFVVAAEQSSPQAVKDAIQQISSNKMIGLVLNKARDNPFFKQGYGYGYGYGYGEGTRASRKSSS